MLIEIGHVSFDLINMKIFHFDPINFLKIMVMTPKQVTPLLVTHYANLYVTALKTANVNVKN